VQKKRKINNTNLNNPDRNVNVTIDENEELQKAQIDDIILFLKSATQDQKAQIISKHKDTFQYRRKFCLNVHFFKIFPRFLDTPELVSYLL